MVKIWDGLMKRLMQASPQDLVSWIFPDAIYAGVLNTELQKDPVRPSMYPMMTRKPLNTDNRSKPHSRIRDTNGVQ